MEEMVAGTTYLYRDEAKKRIFQATQGPHEKTKKDYMRFRKTPKIPEVRKDSFIFQRFSKDMERFRKVTEDSKKSEWFQNNPIDCFPKFYKRFKRFREISYVSGRCQEYAENTRTFQKIPENSKGFHTKPSLQRMAHAPGSFLSRKFENIFAQVRNEN